MMPHTIHQQIVSMNLPERVQVVTVRQGDASFTDFRHFPASYLRDLAIAAVRTSHYLVVDPAFFLPSRLVSRLSRLAPSMLAPRSAVVLPLFSRPSSEPADTYEWSRGFTQIVAGNAQVPSARTAAKRRRDAVDASRNSRGMSARPL